MRIKFWGTRGSIPTPGPTTVRYGGNTPCIEVRPREELLFIVDAGTGIRALGEWLVKNTHTDKIKAYIFISHTHWDHIQGFPFFMPAFRPGNEFHVYGPDNKSIRSLLADQMHLDFFPVSIDSLNSEIQYHALQEGEHNIDGVKVISRYLNHGNVGAALGYRFEYNKKSFVYVSDSEPYQAVFGVANDTSEVISKEMHKFIKNLEARMIDFCMNADVLCHDCMYTPEEYKTKVGWGHSPLDYVVNLAIKTKVKNLVIFHHDPVHDDAFLDKFVERAKKMVGDNSLNIIGASEGLELNL